MVIIIIIKLFKSQNMPNSLPPNNNIIVIDVRNNKSIYMKLKRLTPKKEYFDKPERESTYIYLFILISPN